MSLYSNKSKGSGAVQPWSETLPFGKDIRNFYNSRGDAVLLGTNEIVTLLDGPEKVVMYDNLVVGDGTTATTLTASSRCKGITLIVHGNLLVKANATIHMTGRGARVDRNDDIRFPFIDFKIPNKIGLYSEAMSRKAALQMIANKGLAPWDRGFWDVDGGAAGLNCSIVDMGAITLLQASTCGAGGGYVSAGSNSYVGGVNGAAGSNGGCGGGGSGGIYTMNNGPGAHTRSGGSGHPYSGGSGSGGINNNYNGYQFYYGSYLMPDVYSGPGTPGFNGNQGGAGSGAGNPSVPGISPTLIYHGTGGKLVIICFGNVTVNAGGKIEANGVASGYYGGASGGGHISLIYGGTYSNSGTIQAAGGSGGGAVSGGSPGGSGGAGSVVTKTFSDMGW